MTRNGLQKAVDKYNIEVFVNKHISKLIQVPEGDILYFRLAEFYVEGFKARDLLSTLKKYLSYFGDTMLTSQFDKIGWLFFNAFQRNGRAKANTPNCRQQLTSLSEQYPELFGVKWWLFIDTILVDITPHSLGIGTLSDTYSPMDSIFGLGRDIDSSLIAAPIITKNTPVPANRTKTFYAVTPFQKDTKSNSTKGKESY